MRFNFYCLLYRCGALEKNGSGGALWGHGWQLVQHIIIGIISRRNHSGILVS